MVAGSFDGLLWSGSEQLVRCHLSRAQRRLSKCAARASEAGKYSGVHNLCERLACGGELSLRSPAAAPRLPCAMLIVSYCSIVDDVSGSYVFLL